MGLKAEVLFFGLLDTLNLQPYLPPKLESLLGKIRFSLSKQVLSEDHPFLRVSLGLGGLGHADGGDLLPPPRLDRRLGRRSLLLFGGGDCGVLVGVLANAHDALRPAADRCQQYVFIGEIMVSLKNYTQGS